MIVVYVYATAAFFALFRLLTVNHKPSHLTAEQIKRAEQIRPTFRKITATVDLVLFACAAYLFWQVAA